MRDNEEEKLARIEQMVEDLTRQTSEFRRISMQVRKDAEAARLALENARRELRQTRLELVDKLHVENARTARRK